MMPKILKAKAVNKNDADIVRPNVLLNHCFEIKDCSSVTFAGQTTRSLRQYVTTYTRVKTTEALILHWKSCFC